MQALLLSIFELIVTTLLFSSDTQLAVESSDKHPPFLLTLDDQQRAHCEAYLENCEGGMHTSLFKCKEHYEKKTYRYLACAQSQRASSTSNTDPTYKKYGFVFQSMEKRCNIVVQSCSEPVMNTTSWDCKIGSLSNTFFACIQEKKRRTLSRKRKNASLERKKLPTPSS